METKKLPAASRRAGLSGKNSQFAQGAWKGALDEYLRTSYKDGGPMCDIESGGAVYKVMKKDDEITFYDAAGSTLFHISYEQLEKEHAELMERQGKAGRKKAGNVLC